MRNINIVVRNKIARNADGTEYICGNSDFLVNFDFDAEWDAYDAKTARFIYGSTYKDIVFQGNQCKMPIMSNTNTILCGNGSPAAPSDDVYNQIMEMMRNLLVRIEALEQGGGGNNGEDSVSSVLGVATLGNILLA